jgi:hypothetical protein
MLLRGDDSLVVAGFRLAARASGATGESKLAREMTDSAGETATRNGDVGRAGG